jgi:hypothetical protein
MRGVVVALALAVWSASSSAATAVSTTSGVAELREHRSYGELDPQDVERIFGTPALALLESEHPVLKKLTQSSPSGEEGSAAWLRHLEAAKRAARGRSVPHVGCAGSERGSEARARLEALRGRPVFVG